MTNIDSFELRGPERVVLNGLIVWGRIVGTTLASILTTRFMLAALGVEGLGVFLVTSAITIALSFLTGAMHLVSQRALTMCGTEPRHRHRIFNASLGLHFGVGLIIILAGELIGGWVLRNLLVIPALHLASAEQVLRLFVMTAAFGAFLAPYEVVLKVDERFAIFAMLDVLRAATLMLISLWLTSFDGDRLVAFGWAGALTTSAAAILGALMATRGRPELRIRFALFFNLDVFRTQIRLFGWTLLGSLSVVARNQGIAIVVNIFFGPVGSAAYGIGNQLISAIRQLSSTVSTILMPRIFSTEARGRRDAMIKASLLNCRFSSLVALSFAVPMLAEIDMLLELWLGTPPQMAGLVANLLILGFLIDQLSEPAGTAHLAVGTIARYQVVCGLLTVTTVPLAYFAGAQGQGISFILYILAAMAAVVAWQRVALLEPHAPMIVKGWMVGVILRVLASAAPAGLAALLIVTLLAPGLMRLVFTSVLSGAVLLVTSYRFGLTSGERTMFAALLSKWRRRVWA